MRLAELFKESGLPDGVFNVINGDKELVSKILQNEKNKINKFCWFYTCSKAYL